VAQLKDTIGYILKSYPDNLQSELSNARLTKMVYLSDWKHLLNDGRTITDIDWYFDNYGPFVRDVEETANQFPSVFKVSTETNAYGKRKKVYSLVNERAEFRLSESERLAVDHIINVTKKLFWDDFIQLVYATYPVSTSERYTYLDLSRKAAEYKKLGGGLLLA